VLLAVPVSAAQPAGPAKATDAALRTLGVQGAEGSGRPAPVDGEVTVTLITGDRVTVTTVDGRSSVALRPDSVRPGVSYSVLNNDRGVAVVPSDAVALLGAGKVDPRLFDVTQLAAWGYDDSRVDSIPLLTKRTAKDRAAVPRGAELRRSFEQTGTDSLRVRKGKAGDVWKDLTAPTRRGVPALNADVGKVWLDGKSTVSDDVSNSQVGAPSAWASGYTGAGVRVAVLDTGYDATHPDLAGVVVASQDFTASPTGVVDGHGHGTHVASILAGSGAASAGKYKGVAPDADVVVGKVCDDTGQCPDSSVLAGIEWAVNTQHAQVVNISLGRPAIVGADPLVDAVNGHSVFSGVTFVVAAGNSGGSGHRTIEAPGNARFALTVGATWPGDTAAWFTSRGPTLTGESKPDLVAPGYTIVAARAAGTSMGAPVDANYTKSSGTSMATPMVAGAMAIKLQQSPNALTVYARHALTSSARRLPGVITADQGMGMLDIPASLQRHVNPGTSPLINLASPHTAGQTGVGSASIRNGTASSVTATTTAEVFDEAGRTAPAGLLTIDNPTLTIAAGATGSLGLTAHANGVASGAYNAIVTGRSGGVTLFRVLVSINVDAPLRTVGATSYNRAGVVNAAQGYLMADGAKDWYWFSISATGVMSCTTPWGTGTGCVVPEGRYLMYGLSNEYDAGGTSIGSNNFFRPVTVGASNVALALSAQTSVPIGMSVDTVGARQNFAAVGVSSSQFGRTENLIPWGGTANINVVPVVDSRLTYIGNTGWTDGTATSPYRYWLVDKRTGGIPTNPGFAATKATLAKVPSDYVAPGVASAGNSIHVPRAEGTDLSSVYDEHAFPRSTIDYLTPGSGVTWRKSYSFTGANDAAQVESGNHYSAYVTGNNPTQANNAAPYAMTVPDNRVATRQGDVFEFGRLALPSLFGTRDVGNLGYSSITSGTATLKKNGVTLGSTGLYDGYFGGGISAVLPAATGTYDLRATATRDASATPLSSSVDVNWRFQSAHTDPTVDTPVTLLVPTVIQLGLDNHNRAQVGTTTSVLLPVYDQNHAVSSLSALTLEYSTNDGATWTATGASSTNQGAYVPNGATPGFVSLRVTAADTAGNSVTETVIRAWAVKV